MSHNSSFITFILPTPFCHLILQLCWTTCWLPGRLFSPSVLVNLPSNSLSHQPRDHLLLEAVFDHSSPHRLHWMPPPAMCMLCIYLSDNFCARTNICSFNCPSPHTVSSLMARSKSFISRSPGCPRVFYNRRCSIDVCEMNECTNPKGQYSILFQCYTKSFSNNSFMCQFSQNIIRIQQI